LERIETLFKETLSDIFIKNMHDSYSVLDHHGMSCYGFNSVYSFYNYALRNEKLVKEKGLELLNLNNDPNEQKGELVD